MTIITCKSGKTFDYLSPKFDINDIGHALSHIARFNGHATERWSVAQHLLACAKIAEPPFKFEALVHDAHEAFICDVPTPLKALLPDYQELEERIEQAMRQQWCLPVVMSDAVRAIDAQLLNAEAYMFHRHLWDQLGMREPGHFAIEAIQSLRHKTQVEVAKEYIEVFGFLFRDNYTSARERGDNA